MPVLLHARESQGSYFSRRTCHPAIEGRRVHSRKPRWRNSLGLLSWVKNLVEERSLRLTDPSVALAVPSLDGAWNTSYVDVPLTPTRRGLKVMFGLPNGAVKPRDIRLRTKFCDKLQLSMGSAKTKRFCRDAEGRSVLACGDAVRPGRESRHAPAKQETSS